MKNKSNSPAPKSVYIFVDNSNIWITGKQVSGRSKAVPVPSNYWYRVDYGKLLDLVKGVRPLGDMPKLYGSEPPPVDSVWDRIKEHGYNVTLFKRNIFNKEKGLDMKLGMDMTMLAMRVRPPGIVALVAGDADYEPVVKQLISMGWEVEVWYWSNAAKVLRDAATYFHPLNSRMDQIGFEGRQTRNPWPSKP